MSGPINTYLSVGVFYAALAAIGVIDLGVDLERPQLVPWQVHALLLVGVVLFWPVAFLLGDD